MEEQEQEEEEEEEDEGFILRGLRNYRLLEGKGHIRDLKLLTP